MFTSEDEATRDFLREQLISDTDTPLSHQLNNRYSLLVEYNEERGMVVKATKMDRVTITL